MAPIQLPKDPSRPFTSSGVNYGQLYNLARALGEGLAGRTDKPVCLAVDSHLAAGAALLCSLAGGPDLIIPHALSARVLAEAHAATGFELVLGEVDSALPPGTHAFWPQVDEAEAAAPAIARPEHEPFMSLFTGGSSGRPKVWTKTVHNLLAEAAHLSKRFGLTGNDVFLSTVPPLHIYGLLFSVLLPMAVGGTVVVGSAFLPPEIAARLQNEKPTVFISGPAHYRALRATEIEAPGLRIAFSSGGMLDATDGAHFSTATRVGVTEVYGSTETGGIATRCRAEGQTDWTPLSGVRWAVRDERLCVASDFLSPELPREADGLFVTGDRVEPTAGKRFALLGRADGIVKVGGKRVDLLEVEQKLRSLDGVTDAHVLAVDSPGRGADLVALVVSPLSEETLRDELANLLEAHALPRRFLHTSSIPTTPAGKRDKPAIDDLVSQGSKG